MRNNWTDFAKYVLGLCCLTLLAPHAGATVVTWNSPELDVWTYPAAVDPGGGIYGPTFLTEPGLDEFDQFLPQTGRDPARRGMTFAGFETSNLVAPNLLPSQYQINSVTVTFRMGETALGGDIHYDDTPDTNAELLDDYVTGNIDTARPMELYGVGFQAGFTGFDFATNPGAMPFSESMYPYADPNPSSPTPGTGDDVLAAYPIGADAMGQYVDVSNNLTGGFSATAPGNTTVPFDSTPWAIGSAVGLSPGDVIPDDQTFSFAIDLGLAGVAQYLQQGLAEGALGFYLSSQHFSGDFHGGGGIPYPRWYTKEFPSHLGGEAPTLEIDYSLLPMPGDFDLDDDVDSLDFAQWEGDFGLNGDSDADGDGDSDGLDFLAWQRNFGRGMNSEFAAAVHVPEPSSVALFTLGLIWLGLVSSNRASRKSKEKL